MSLAWGSLVLLVVLLPGILFFVGTYFPEQFTREAEPRSPLGQLAGALLISFVVHGAAYAVSGSFCGGVVPCISIKGLLETVSFDPRVPGSADAIESMLRQFRWWIFSYVLGTSGIGIALGAWYGRLTSKRRIRGLSRHPWVHDLSVDGLTYAYVLTNIQHEDRILMYKGFLRAFGLQQDGRFSYIVLSDVTRLYMRLGEDGSETSALEKQKIIGASSPSGIPLSTESGGQRRRLQSLFVIEGEDIANAVFDVLEIAAKPVKDDELRKILREEAKAIDLDLSELEIDDILGLTK